MNDSLQFYLRAGTKMYRCSAFEGEECVAGTCIATTSAEDAAQSMAEEMIESSDGAWSGGKVEVLDQSGDSDGVRTFLVSFTLTELADEEVAANVTLEEISNH